MYLVLFNGRYFIFDHYIVVTEIKFIVMSSNSSISGISYITSYRNLIVVLNYQYELFVPTSIIILYIYSLKYVFLLTYNNCQYNYDVMSIQ